MPNTLRVVAVDDEPDILFVLKMFMPRSVDFREASDLKTALAAVEGGADVILSDFHFRAESFTGIDVIRECRAKLGPGPKIYLMSGTANVKDKADAIAAGADGFLPKPFQMIEVQQLIANLQGE